jgi:hypothetical protein
VPATSFTPVTAAAGGALLGAASSLLLLGRGRVAGVSGIVAGVFPPHSDETAWRAAFLAGMLVAGGVGALQWPGAFATTLERGPITWVVAGVLVGFGTRLGSGCTSGHGVCGLSRGSPRALVATLTFLASGALSATLARVLTGGGP